MTAKNQSGSTGAGSIDVRQQAGGAANMDWYAAYMVAEQAGTELPA